MRKSQKVTVTFFLIREMVKKSVKISLTFDCQAMSGADGQDKVDPGTSGCQNQVQASHEYRNVASARSGGSQRLSVISPTVIGDFRPKMRCQADVRQYSKMTLLRKFCFLYVLHY